MNGTTGFRDRFDGFVFDLDGTLVDTFVDIQTAINLVRRDLAMPPLDLETVTTCVGQGARQLVRRTIGNLDASEEARLVGLFRAYYREHLHDCSRLYPNVVATLDSLAGHKLAVLSNKPHEPCVDLLRALGILDRFMIVRGQDDRWPSKPDPGSLLYIVRDVFQTSPERTLMVGDWDTDVFTARNAGTPCAIVRTGMARFMGAVPDWYLDDIAELSR